MEYNIHPLVVHFPIALLLTYSVIKILPVRKWFPSVAWKDIERVLLVFGVLGAFASLSTGELAEELTNQNEKLVETHAFFAVFSTWTYGALLIGEAAQIFNARKYVLKGFEFVTTITTYIEKYICMREIQVTLALLGLLAITVTGMLGGIMVYGTSADPLAPYLLTLLNISL
jgi:uncharacterized membrane protein